jgi:exopolyphosphatase/guanosine-5'-triphosphate,3'-diphosphate pyrophosphatase
LLGWPGSYGLVCDIGGSSMELAEIAGGRVGRRISSNLGPLKLRDLKGGQKGRDQHIKDVMGRLADHMGPQRDRLFLVGGSWRAIARIDMYRRGYPLHVLHEYRMDKKSVSQTVKFIKSSDPEELRQACGVSSTRMDLVPYAVDVLKRLVQTFKPKDIAISSYGIREGLLYEQMPQDLRDRDPLIEACRFAEAKDARLPGFGKKLFRFVSPLFSSSDTARIRLIKAACLLHDVSWRAHPDYRAETCFDNATRANLGGLKHSERVFLGLALLHRYKNKREGTRFEDLEGLLSEKDTKEAEVLGKALRFGAMLWMSDASADGTALDWKPRKKLLRLKLTKASVPLYGEVAEARFASLAASLEAETEVVTLR